MAKSKTEKMSYEQAVENLEELVKKIESPSMPLSKMGDEVKKAMELIKYCKEELKGYQKEFDQITEL